jgi:hypothetical protein
MFVGVTGSLGSVTAVTDPNALLPWTEVREKLMVLIGAVASEHELQAVKSGTPTEPCPDGLTVRPAVSCRLHAPA